MLNFARASTPLIRTCMLSENSVATRLLPRRYANSRRRLAVTGSIWRAITSAKTAAISSAAASPTAEWPNAGKYRRTSTAVGGATSRQCRTQSTTHCCPDHAPGRWPATRRTAWRPAAASTGTGTTESASRPVATPSTAPSHSTTSDSPGLLSSRYIPAAAAASPRRHLTVMKLIVKIAITTVTVIRSCQKSLIN